MIKDYSVNDDIYDMYKAINDIAFRFSEKEPDEIKRIVRNLAYFREEDVFNGDKLYQDYD
jgi:hypothetical protein